MQIDTKYSLDTKGISSAVSASVADISVPKIQAEAQKPKQLTSEDFFNKKADDIDLTADVYNAIKIIISEEAANSFIKDPIIMVTKDTASIYQRVLINRYFIQFLVRARAYLDLEGLTMIFASISNEGTHMEWLQNLNRVVLPYLKTNKVYEFFKDVENEVNKNLSKSE